ncbi:MAG: hypothetical protein E7635_00205 [Ruminococcaceae bacterium]|nr:hypothetical protein [Oscillospiraceae bacterium]
MAEITEQKYFLEGETKMKKFLALVLAVLMIASTVVSVSAFTDVAEDYAHVDAINALQEYSVVQGKSATEFAPDENVTRLQMALFMARATTAIVDDAEWAEGDENLFADCTQYLGAIQYCFTQGIIKGVNATEFAPEANITLRDGVIMAVRALGYEKEDEGKDVYNKKYNVQGANYWLPYYQTAKEIGLLENLDKLAVTKALTRGETAQLIWNMLNTEVYVGGDDYNNNYTLADVVFGGKQIVNVNSVVAAYISETPLQSIGADTIGEDEEIVVITVLDESEGNPEVEVPFADLEEAGVDVENIEEYFGAYIELINCRVAYSGKDEDGYVVYKDYEYLSGVSKANAVELTNADIQYHKNEDRIRIEGKTHYFDVDSKARNYIALYTANEAEDGWEQIDDYDANDALYGKLYDITLIDTDLDGYYEIGLVTYYNIAEYAAAKTNGKAACGIMKGIKDVEFSEELTAGDVFVYTYNPFANTVEVKEVLVMSEGKITGYSDDIDDGIKTAVIEIDGVDYEVVDDTTTAADDLVVSAFDNVENADELIEDSIIGEDDLAKIEKAALMAAAEDNVGAEVEYYLYNGNLLAIGDEVDEAAATYLVVKEWTDFELGEYIVATAIIDGIEQSIKINKVYTATANGLKKTEVADLGYNKLSKLLEGIFGMYSYTVDEDGYYIIKEYTPSLKVGDYFNTADHGVVNFSEWQTKWADVTDQDREDIIRVNSSTVIYVVNEDDEEVDIVTPAANFSIEFFTDMTDAAFIADKIGFGDTAELHSTAGYGIKHGVASFLYFVTDGDYTSVNRAGYQIVFVESALKSVGVGSAADFDLELGEEDINYYKYTAKDAEAYLLSTFKTIDEMYVDKNYRATLDNNKIVPGVYLINKDNIVVDHIKAANLTATNTLVDGNVDFPVYVKTLKASEINLFDYAQIRFDVTDADLSSLKGTANIQTITFKFFENDGEETYAVNKSDKTLIEYLNKYFTDAQTGDDIAVDVLVAPNAYTGFNSEKTFTDNTFRGIVYNEIIDVADPTIPTPPQGGNDPVVKTTYTVSYDLNYAAPEGTYVPEAQEVQIGLSVTLNSAALARANYTFAGWAKDSSATVADFAAGATYQDNADVTLYAVWTANP